MNLETTKVPKLVNSNNFIVKELPSSPPVSVVKPKKVNLNWILLGLFVICTICFLYYCKYKSHDLNLIPVCPFNLYEKY
jgi:hypothetical protein